MHLFWFSLFPGGWGDVCCGLDMWKHWLHSSCDENVHLFYRYFWDLSSFQSSLNHCRRPNAAQWSGIQQFYSQNRRSSGIGSLVVGAMETGMFTGSQARHNSPRQAGSTTGRQTQQFVVEDRRQAGIPGNQAWEAGQKQAGSITGGQTGKSRWKDSHTAKSSLAPNDSSALTQSRLVPRRCRCVWLGGVAQVVIMAIGMDRISNVCYFYAEESSTGPLTA